MEKIADAGRADDFSRADDNDDDDVVRAASFSPLALTAESP